MDYGGLIWHIHKALNEESNRRLQAYGLTAKQQQLLKAVRKLASENGRVNQRAIQDALNLSNPTVSGLLERLEAKGFIVRTPDPADKRGKLIAVTDREKRCCEASALAIQAQEQKLTEGMSEGEKALLHELLEKMLHNLESENT